MNKKAYDRLHDNTLEREAKMREAGQKEYAILESNVFGDFDFTAELLGTSRESVILTHICKHLRGIASWVRGHKSQRESVRGRITDLRVYLSLLDASVQEREYEENNIQSIGEEVL